MKRLVLPEDRSVVDWHGSEAGYAWHRRHGETPCLSCMRGAARASADRKARLRGQRQLCG